MAISSGTRAGLLVVSALVAALAIFYPSIPQQEDAPKCPLGYKSGDKGPLPPGHPAVPGHRKRPKAAAVYFNGTIWTGEEEMPWATALSVTSDGIIANIGSDADVVSNVAASAERINLQGQFVTPGLIDPHVHMLVGGLSLQQVDLSGVASREQFTQTLATACGKTPSGEFVVGWGWDEQHWGGTLPDASWIDCPQNPVFASRVDGHMALVNAAALDMGGVMRDTPAPPGGKIHRDAAGNPNGLLADAAMALVSGQLPAVSAAAKKSVLQLASDYLLSRGVTMVHDMGRSPYSEEQAWADFEEGYLGLAEDGQLRVRVLPLLPLVSWQRLADYVRANGTRHRGNRLLWGALKEFSDGSLGARTALMHAPYTDDPTSSGLATVDFAIMEEQVRNADAAGLQVAIHAIGDKATDEVLAAYTRVKATGSKPLVEQRHIQDDGLRDNGLPSQRDDGLPTHIDDGLPSQRDTGLPTYVDDGLPSQHDGGLPTHVDEGLPSQVDDGLRSLRDHGLPAHVDHGLPSQRDDGLPTHVDDGLPTHVVDGLPSQRDAALRSLRDHGLPQHVDDGLPSLPHRVEHAQHISGPEAAMAFAATGTWAVVNPLHLPLDVAALEPRLGRERGGEGRSYAFATLQKAGVQLALASDWPVVPAEPLEGIHVAVHRVSSAGGAAPQAPRHAPAEALTADAALLATTLQGARLAGLEDELGSLRPGKRADFVVMSGNPMETAPSGDVPRVLQTYVDGKCAFGCGSTLSGST